MKECLKKLVILLIAFGIVYIAVYNIVNIDMNVHVPKDAKIITSANKNIATGALAVIGVSALLEVYELIKYINTTVSPETFKKNLVKLILLSIALVIICVLCYMIYMFTSVTRFTIV